MEDKMEQLIMLYVAPAQYKVRSPILYLLTMLLFIAVVLGVLTVPNSLWNIIAGALGGVSILGIQLIWVTSPTKPRTPDNPLG